MFWLKTPIKTWLKTGAAAMAITPGTTSDREAGHVPQDPEWTGSMLYPSTIPAVQFIFTREPSPPVHHSTHQSRQLPVLILPPNHQAVERPTAGSSAGRGFNPVQIHTPTKL